MPRQIPPCEAILFSAPGIRGRSAETVRLAVSRRLVLRPEDLVRPSCPLEVEGLAALRRFIGLDS